MKKIILLSTICLSTLTAVADDVDSIPFRKVSLDEVIVVGCKHEPGAFLPSAVSNVSKSQLLLNEIKSVRELNGFIPNFYMPDYGSKQGSNLFIRGLGTRTAAATPSAVFYVDGVPHFESSSFDIDLMGISNIEVLRGPQGTLYGRNSTAGVINLYTFSPLDYAGTEVRLGYGNRNDLNVGVDHYSKQSERVGMSFGAHYHQNDGYFRNVTTGGYADAIKEGAARYALEWNMAPRWRMRLSSDIDLSSQKGYPYGVYDVKTGSVADVNYDANTYYDRLIWTNGLNFRFKGDKFSFNSQTAYQLLNDDQQIDQDFTPKSVVAVTNNSRQHLWSQEFTFKSTTASRYRWVFGAFGFVQNLNRYTYIGYANPAQIYWSRPQLHTANLALYHQSSFDITDKLTAIASIRLDQEWATYKLTKEYMQKKAANQNFDVDKSVTQISPKLALQYTFIPGRMIYTSVAKGYKAGGINQVVPSVDDFIYLPEKTVNYEVGTKLNFRQNRLSLEASAFYIRMNDMQLANQTPTGNYITNANKATSKGVEVSMGINLVRNLSFRLNYGYTDARLKEYKSYDRATKKEVDYAGNRIPLVPCHTIGALANYTVNHPCRFIDRFVANLGVTAVGPIYFKEDNVLRQNLYALVNGKVAVSKGIVTWELWSKNLTGTDYLTYVFSTSQYYAQKGRPIQFGTSLVFNF